MFQVSGISFAFDSDKPAGKRIDPAYIKIGDEYLNPERTYRLVTKAYLANGKDGYDVLAKCKQVSILFSFQGYIFLTFDVKLLLKNLKYHF